MKGCGKRFDILSYGYVNCGEFYNNVLCAGDDRIVYCKDCSHNVQKLPKEDKDE